MIKSRLKTLKFATLGFLVLLLVLFPAGSVFADGLGHGFSGTVKVGGVDADIGTVISAQVGGTEYGSCEVTTVGNYGLIVGGKIGDKIDEGATIDFYVDGRKADQTHPFHDGWTTIAFNLTAPPVQYDLTISSTAGGSVTTPGEGTFPDYDVGTVVSLVAEADTGYLFVNWTGDTDDIADVNDPTTTITMNGDYTIQANFGEIPPVQYELTISSSSGGSVTTPGEGIFTRDAGTVVSLVASPSAGYQFVNWTGDVSTVANVNDPTTTITMNGDYTIKANFEAEAPPPPDQYVLTISSTSGGSVTTPGQGSFTYNEGTVVSLEASPSAGQQFVNWTGDVGTVADVNDPTTTITMYGDYTIRANFEEIQVIYYTLTIAVNGSGSTSPAVGQHDYNAITTVSISATPDPGNRFVNWTGDTGDIVDVNAASTIIMMRGDYEIVANFEAIPPEQFELTISSSAGGSVTIPGEGSFTYNEGDVVSLVATPNPGNLFINWTGDVGTVADVNDPTTSITMNGDCTIKANFEPEAEPPPDEEETNWPLIGGSIFGGLALLFLILLRRRRKRA